LLYVAFTVCTIAGKASSNTVLSYNRQACWVGTRSTEAEDVETEAEELETEAEDVEQATREGLSFSNIVSTRDKQRSTTRRKQNALGRPLLSSL